jgi:general secretion pathway protein D
MKHPRTIVGVRLAGLFVALAMVAGCAAEHLHQQGMDAFDHGEYEASIAQLAQASARDPDNLTYRIDLQARRDQAVHKLIADGDAARAAGQLEPAAASYRRVLGLEPSNDRAIKGLEGVDADHRHGSIVAEAQKDVMRKDYDAADAKLRMVLNEDPGYVPAVDLSAQIVKARGASTVIPKLKAHNDAKVTLQFRDAPTKMVFEVLARQTGINFILDKDVKSDSKTTIFVQDVPIEQAIDLVLDQNALARQVLSPNMVLIYPNTAAKQKDYEQQIVHAFYLTNAVPKDVENMLKTVLGAKTLFVNEHANLVVMRDTPDAIRMAEKLVASVDVADPEVMLEVQVLEIARSRLMDLGIAYPSAVTATANSPSGASGLVLSDLAHLRSASTGISSLSATLNAMETVGLTNTLASPRIRVRNREKAKILIGSRVPVITNSVTPTASGSAVVTGSVQYLEVGLTLEVEPVIHLDGEVAIKLGLEVSSIQNQVTTSSGTVAYAIGTRNANTLLELRDGETQVLAGLIQDSDTRSDANIPGLGDIPVIGRLFGSRNTDREKSEIVLSITPRLIRTQSRPDSDVSEFWYGSESRMSSSPLGAPYLESTSMNAPGPSPITGAPSAPMGAMSGGMATVSGGSSTAGDARVATSGPTASTMAATADAIRAAAQAGAAGGPAPKPTASLNGPTEVGVGQEFDVNLHLTSDTGIGHLHGQVRFDPTALQLISAGTGSAVPASAGSPKVDERSGGVQVDVTSEDNPIQGQGDLMLLRFRALAPRSGSVVAAQVSALGAGGAPLATAQAAPLSILIQAPQ